ncbi:acetate--CoA ligase family protein [candidate division CSSED10-310 bacterium]|uniref:Acetate--CoA ligase family protein n=1 Tax=candidate division CSSED10-310 bacterium TaxID=2855610 RepID=A0ABV6YTU0_UNCC1
MAHPLESIFRPKTIAVIGTSRQEGTIGREILYNLLEFEFNGMVFPVNPKAPVIHSMKCYRSILEIPEDVDLAIIVVPKEHILRAAEECGLKGVKGIVAITAGFKEIGSQGVELERRLLEIVQRYKMRMIGPNCMGVINTEKDYMMNATFASGKPLPGHVAFISQSGALGAAILGHARELRLGISKFVSIGNKADTAADDLLDFLKDDEETRLILLYLENFGNPRRFTKVAKEISRQKPIIAVKSGRTLAGARAASSHTGALAGLDVAADALFEQCGVLRVTSVEELFDLAMAFNSQPIPKGDRVAIITNAGGPAIMATDACVNLGLTLPRLKPETRAKLKKMLPEEASIENPVDMIGSAKEKHYAEALQVVLPDDSIDTLLAIFVPPMVTGSLEVVATINRISKQFAKPVLGCFMGRQDVLQNIESKPGEMIPIYPYPESAVKAIEAMVRYRAWQMKPESSIRTFPVQREKVTLILEQVRQEQRRWLTEGEISEVMAAYAFPLPCSAIVRNVDEALAAIKDIGYPVVLKVTAPGLLHKSDVGGVLVDIRNDRELTQSIHQLSTNMATVKDTYPTYRIIIQQLIKGGRETIMGMALDPGFGPLIMFGLGGIYVEILKDVSFRVNPISELAAREMIESLRAKDLLMGARGEKPVHIDSIIENLQRLSQLVADFDILEQIDINPFIFSEDPAKCFVIDARIAVKLEKAAETKKPAAFQ